MTNDDNNPDVSELSEINRDYSRHRASRAWVNEAFVMCTAAFGVGTYGVVNASARNGYLSAPGIIGTVLFGFAVAAVVASYRSLGPRSTYSEPKRRTLRKRLVLAVIAAALPLAVGLVGQLFQFAAPTAGG